MPPFAPINVDYTKEKYGIKPDFRGAMVFMWIFLEVYLCLLLFFRSCCQFLCDFY